MGCSENWWEEEKMEDFHKLKAERYLPILKKPKFEYHECNVCHYHFMESDMDMVNGHWVCRKCED